MPRTKPLEIVEPQTRQVYPFNASPLSLEPISYDIKAAALVTHATEFFIGCAIRSGKLPAKRLGKKYVIFRKDLEKFVEEAEAAA